MPTSQMKTLSPAELAKLEHAFATDPSSDAYKALAQAYLGMGRFMEAMVVCKKGVKAHPAVADPRVLLARVYAEQGKDKKALEELALALQVAPADQEALRMLGGLQLKNGEAEAGKASLLKALEADPKDELTRAELEKWGVSAPAPAAPEPPPVAAPPPPPPAAAPQAQGSQQVQAYAPPPAAPATNGASASRASPGTPAPAPRPQAQAPRAARPAQRPAPRPAPRPEWNEEAASEEVEVPRARSKKARISRQRSAFFALLVLAPVTLVGYSYWRGKVTERNRAIKKHLDVVSEELKHDSFSSYKKACEAADKVLDLDSSSLPAHGYLAYAWSIRWGEHGGGDEARKRAEEHLAEAKKAKEPSSQLFAADALFKSYAGKGQEAAKELQERVKQLEETNRRSSLIYLTLGMIQMNLGDLDRAKDALDLAQKLASDDPRVYAALGTLFRRKGQDPDAEKNFVFALRFERDHPESLLGRALLLLEKENPQFYVEAAKMIRKLVDADPPPSPRQLATAHLARGFLISRVSHEVGFYKPEFQKELLDGTQVPSDKKVAQSQLAKEEDLGFNLDRTNPELHLIKGRRLFLEGQHDQAVEEIRKAVAMDRSRAQFYVELARALMAKKGGEKEAQEALITAIRTMGNSPKLVLMLGEAYQRQGSLDKALEQFQLALGDGKQRAPDTRLAMGLIYREKKDFTRAAELFDRAAQDALGQPSKVAQAYTELARTHEERGDRVKAGETYQLAIKADEAYPDMYYFFARYLSGDKGQARTSKLAAQEYLSRAPRGEYAQDAQRLTQ